MVQQEPVIFDKKHPDYIKKDVKLEKFEIISQVIYQTYQQHFSGIKQCHIYFIFESREIYNLKI